MNYYHLHQNKGFTLVETLVAISILLIVIVGPMSITARTARTTTFSSEQVTAFFLAQEGLELAQKARDELLLRNFLTTGSTPLSPIANPWAQFISTYASCIGTSNTCKLEVTDAGGVSVAACGDCRLYRSTAAGPVRSRFTHTPSAITTPYTRTIQMENLGDEVRVTSTVTWRTGGLLASQRVQVESFLVNIYDTP